MPNCAPTLDAKYRRQAQPVAVLRSPERRPSPSAADGPPMASNFAASASMPQSVEDITLGPYSVAASSSYQAGSPTSERWQGGGVMNDEYQAGGVTSGSV